MNGKAKIIVTIALMLGMCLTALDTTIVGTALPSIVGKLGGITLYSWVFSIYLLTSTTTVPIYGKLADLYGRKPLFLFGSLLFLAGSVACGMAQSMEQLILFRAIQGLGAGAVQPIVLTIIGDIFSLQERARVQGLFSGVWGLSSIIGPALGGLIVDHFSWRWVFYINIPFGLLSILLLIIAFKENVERSKPQIDYLGSFALTGSIVAMLFALLQGGTNWAWLSLPSIGLFVSAILLLVFFLYQERHTAEPILPLTLFSNRIIAVSSVGALLLGIVMFGISSYVPLFIQGVQGATATGAGITLGPMLLAWPLAAAFSGKLILRYGFRLIALLGTFLTMLGMGMVTLFNVQTPLYFIVGSMVVIGAGLGFSSTSYMLSVQGAVPWNLRGVATASNQFFRTIGGTLGVALMGTILNAQVAQHFDPIFARLGSIVQRLPKNVSPANVLLAPELRSLLPAATLQELQVGLAQSLFWVYVLMLILAILGFGLMYLLPGGKAEQYAYREQSSEEAASSISEALIG